MFSTTECRQYSHYENKQMEGSCLFGVSRSVLVVVEVAWRQPSSKQVTNGCTPFFMQNMYFKKYILIIVALLSSISAFAKNYDVQLINGIYYYVRNNSSHGTNLVAYVTDVANASSVTELTIPQTIKATWYSIAGNKTWDYETNATVVGIKQSFVNLSVLKKCVNLRRIILPSSIKEIEYGAFDCCSSLTDIIVDEDNATYCSINGILYSKDKTSLIRVPLAKQEATINNTTTRIDSKAFFKTQVKDIFIPKSVESIGDYSFSSTSNLIKIQVDSENNSFYSDGDALLTKEKDRLVFLLGGVEFYSIPKTVTECQKGALNDNKTVRIIVLPNSLKTTPDFTGCTNLRWIFSFRWTDYSKLPISPTLYMPSTYINSKDASNKNIVSLANITKSQAKINVSTKEVVWFTLGKAYINSEEQNTPIDETVTFSHLTPQKSYMINIQGIYKSFIGGSKEFEIAGCFPVSTLEPILNIESSKVTNTTIVAKGSYEGDMIVTKQGFSGYEEGNKLSLNSLKPGQYVYLTYTITTDDGSIFSTSKPFYTKDVDLDITTTLSSTSCVLKGSYENIDATILASGFKESNSDELKVTGLDPNTSYSRTYYVKTKEGGTTSKTVTFKTKTLQLETLQPKGITNTSSLVSANSNIDDDELTVGFQWRKYDAPSSLKSNEGYATVYNGTLEGFIKNLQTTSYYKVRAFYKSQTDKCYYGEWVTFDPSDFSYFEPTVHTYARVSVQSTSAKVKGVALQGTDDITEQGFEYWAENAIASRAAGDKQIIQATGQSMEAEITDLAPNTTYNYRAYAKTSKGTTYGETLKFTTPVATAIIGITNTTNSDLQFNVRNTNNVQIAINGTDKECNYRMNSITGANIASGKTTADGEWHTIANYQLPSGIYIITVSDGKDKKSTKIAIK